MTDHSSDRPATVVCHAGREPEAYHGFLNTPVFNGSTVLFQTLDDLEAANAGTFPGYAYGRYGNPTAASFEACIAALEGAYQSLATASGVAAVTVPLLSFLNSGDHLLMVDTAYGPTRKFCDQELTRLGVEVTYYDPLIGAGIEALLKPNTRVIFLESPGSLTFEVQDIPAIVAVAKPRGIVTMIDNSWASPLYFQPLKHGVDISIHSATKYINGHSDIVIGVVSATKEAFPRLKQGYGNIGAVPTAQDCYMAQRGIRTLAVRVKQHEASALELARWFEKRPETVKLLHPAFASCPGHEVWKRDFSGSTGLFGVLLKPYPRKALEAMMNGMRFFKMGYSWGGYESLMMPFSPQAVRSATRWQHDGLNLRIHAGLEDVADLLDDLEAGLKRLNAAA